MKLLRAYYEACGYEDKEQKNILLPDTVSLTASTSLRHLLWCEKDKDFLCSLDSNGKPLGKTFPPLRTSHDLRALQQAARMGILLGIEVFPGDGVYLDEIVQREILPIFPLSQLLKFRWKNQGF